MAELGDYREFPKMHDGAREVVDKQAVKDQFMRCQHLSWAKFCEEYGYNPKNRMSFPVRSWTEEKTQLKVELGDEALIEKQVEIRHLLLSERLDFPKTWNDTAKGMMAFLNIEMNQWTANYNWDNENKDLLQRDPSKRRYKFNLPALTKMAHVAKILQDMQAKALLLKQADFAAVVPVKAADQEVIQAEAEENRLKEIGYARLGGGAIDHESLTQLYRNWFDQEKNSQTSEPEPSDNPLLPLTPLEDE